MSRKRLYTRYSYALLLNGANTHLSNAERREVGNFYSSLSAMLHSAFSVEAFFNHIGPELFAYWDNSVQRQTGVKSKFRMIASALNLVPDDYDRLSSAVNTLMGFRNKVVHAETEQGEYAAGETPGAKWEGDCTIGSARRYISLAKDIIVTINVAAGNHEYELYIAGEGSE